MQPSLRVIPPVSTMTAMPPTLEADVATLHFAAGDLRTSPPPGTLAQTAPRRCARGRAEDVLLLTLHVETAEPGSASMMGHIASRGALAFYRTPGSVTAAMREAAQVINAELLAWQDAESLEDQRANLMLGVLRGSDFYMAQAGSGHATLIRGGSVRRFASAEAARRPLGGSASPHVRYHHLQAEPGDVLALTAVATPLASDSTLASLENRDPADLIERLKVVLDQDVTGLLVRLIPEGQGAHLPSAALQPQTATQEDVRQATGQIRERLSGAWSAVGGSLQRAGQAVAFGITKLLIRLAPGLVEAPRPGSLPPSVLAATAVAVPLLVLAIVSITYLRLGRSEQFQANILEAQEAIAAAQISSDPSQQRALWTTADIFLDRASQYGSSPELDALRDQVDREIDALDNIVRLEFQPVLSGGFGREARITTMAASATDLYVLDANAASIWRAWATGRGYEIDRSFDCLEGAASFRGMATPVDMAIQAEPGALGVEGVVAIDADGTLLYCAPNRRALSSELTPPDTGFQAIRAIDVFNDSLYVLDPASNAVWIYDASGGLFSGSPVLYFTEEIPDLSDAIDLAKSQEELFILHSDGVLDRCERTREEQPGLGMQFVVECQQDLQFLNDRPGAGQDTGSTGVVITEMLYSPPPEPSLYFLDSGGRTVFHYSMRMVYQGQYRPLERFPGSPTALTLGPPSELFVAIDDQVFFAGLR